MSDFDELRLVRVRGGRTSGRGGRWGPTLDWADESGENYNEVAWSSVEDADEALVDLL
ncbi:hypothetical protein ACFO0N_02215 [Halobium salinum]|uniref:Uncharacterized protein n=1 Tax=Halobium salinum TaxID=1364940 RepID=A0ABD5P7P1_9EURY|nr:hypothetical protein [Halobium salinum]